jgi:hypothetical protein
MYLIRIGLFALICSVSLDAAAYLDPGTGSIILQGIIAALAVAGMTLKHYWYRIQAFFGKEPPKSLLEDEDAADSKEDVQ